MKLFTTEELHRIDNHTIQEEGVAAQQLIARVAEGVASEVESRFRSTRPIAVFAGPGNNGADALATARLLSEHGYDVKAVYLFNIGGNSLSRDCLIQRDALLASGYSKLVEITRSMDHPELSREYVVIDGLFGTGLRKTGGLTEGYRMLVRAINESGAWVLSIDIPSGISGDWNPTLINRDVVHADLTVTVQVPKMSFFIDDVSPLVGEVKVLDIGLSRAAMRAIPSPYHLIEAQDIRRVLPRRKPVTSKADYGHAILFAGSYGMVGAAIMAARSCLRGGVGKLTIHGPRVAFNPLQTAVPEAMFQPDKKEMPVISEMPAPRPGVSAVGVGCGITTHDVAAAALEGLIMACRVPMVLDADALNILAARPYLLQHLQPGTVLTPHKGEFDRMFGAQQTTEQRIFKAIEVCRSLNCVIVLKGHHSVTVRPDGKLFFNSTGNAGMATAGSGDVLTGLILAFLAQKMAPEIAAVAGVYIHGLAGDIAARKVGQWSLTASDIIDNIPAAFLEVQR